MGSRGRIAMQSDIQLSLNNTDGLCYALKQDEYREQANRAKENVMLQSFSDKTTLPKC
jgi:hypothetical protein